VRSSVTFCSANLLTVRAPTAAILVAIGKRELNQGKRMLRRPPVFVGRLHRHDPDVLVRMSWICVFERQALRLFVRSRAGRPWMSSANWCGSGSPASSARAVPHLVGLEHAGNEFSGTCCGVIRMTAWENICIRQMNATTTAKTSPANIHRTDESTSGSGAVTRCSPRYRCGRRETFT